MIKMDPNESHWIPMDPHGSVESQWILMDTNGSQWIPMDPNESQ